MSLVCFCDVETTGLDPDRHEIWEVGLVVDEEERRWVLPVKLDRADASALRISGFHERYWEAVRGGGGGGVVSQADFAREFRELTDGRHLVGAVISFDEERLRKLLRANEECPMWHYHLVDVEALAAGKLGFSPPWDSQVLSLSVGVDPALFDRHTALGDALWAKAIYEAVIVV